MKNKVKSYSFSERNKKAFSGSFRAPQKKRNFFWIWLLIGLIITLSFIIFLLFSSIFNIKTIKIEGLVRASQAEVEYIVDQQKDYKNLIFSQENLIFFNENKLVKNLQEYNFSNIIVEKKPWKRSLIIKIEEREQSFIFQENDTYFFADKEGNIIDYKNDCRVLSELSLNSGITNEDNKINNNALANSTSSDDFSNLKNIDLDKVDIINNDANKNSDDDVIITNINEDDTANNHSFEVLNEASKCLVIDESFKKDNLYPIIENEGKNRVLDTKYIKLDPQYIDFCLKIYNDLGDNTDFGLKKIVIDEEYNTVKVRLNNDLEVYFSFKNDYSEQISRFFALKKEKSSDLRGKKYIDLRYGDRIFYY